MKLPILVFAFVSRSCQADMNDIKRFLARYNPDSRDEVVGEETREAADDPMAAVVPYGRGVATTLQTGT